MDWKQYLKIEKSDVKNMGYGVYTPDGEYYLVPDGKWWPRKLGSYYSFWDTENIAKNYLDTPLIATPPNYPNVPQVGERWTVNCMNSIVRKTKSFYMIKHPDIDSTWRYFPIKDHLVRIKVWIGDWIKL